MTSHAGNAEEVRIIFHLGIIGLTRNPSLRKYDDAKEKLSHIATQYWVVHKCFTNIFSQWCRFKKMLLKFLVSFCLGSNPLRIASFSRL